MNSGTQTLLQHGQTLTLRPSAPHAFGATIVSRVRAAGSNAAMLDTHLHTTHTYSSITHPLQTPPVMAFHNGIIDDNNDFPTNSQAITPASNFSPTSPTINGPPLHETKEGSSRIQRGSKHPDASSMFKKMLACTCFTTK